MYAATSFVSMPQPKGTPHPHTHTRKGATASSHARTTSSNSAKQAVATKEVERLKTVLSHPAYQRDPHAALREHLKATLGSSDRGSSRPRSQGQGHSQLQRQQRPS